MSTKIYLIDASIYIYKSYFAKSNDYRAKTGESINAVYGFIRFLTQFIHKTKAQYIACAFDDVFSTSFRHEIFPDYKGQREQTPDELKKQFIICQKVAQAMGVACYSHNNYEADDVIGTLAKHYQDKHQQVFIISADKDLTQLITAQDKWWDYGKSEPYNIAKIFAKFGVYPNQIADYLALTGDSVDNIAGVAGVGEKTAVILLNHFKTLDEILLRHQEIAYLSFRGAKACQKNISKNIEQAKFARKLTGIVTDISLDNFDIYRTSIDHSKINVIFDHLKFGPILRKEILAL
ncbi:MAG: exodeoxyribonuclease IX [Proteobacteria bacterium]|nr:exodeoxyribonuclease IX [Pseudomonadota bacterium]